MLILGPGYESGCHSSCSTASCSILRSVLTNFYWPWSGQTVETNWLLLYTTFVHGPAMVSPFGGSQETCGALSLSLSIQTHPVLWLSRSCKTSALRARHPPYFHYAHIHTLHSNTHTHTHTNTHTLTHTGSHIKRVGRMGRGEGQGRKDKAGFVVFRPFTWLEWTRQQGFPLHGSQAPPTSKIFWTCRNSCGMIPNIGHSD